MAYIENEIQRASNALNHVERQYVKQLVQDFSKYQFHGKKHTKARRFFLRKVLTIGLQNVHTPYALCEEILGKLKDTAGEFSDKTFCVLFNLEFVEVLIYNFGVKPEQICFFADDPAEYMSAVGLYEFKDEQNIFLIDVPQSIKQGKLVTNMGEITRKFDCVVGNPPYQSMSGNKGSAHILWDKFASIAHNDLCDDGANVCLVHPSLWRKPGHELRESIKGLTYLEIHDERGGMKTFGAETRYDWYVSKKGYDGKTTIKGQDGEFEDLDLSQWEFIPNYAFDLIKSLLAKGKQEKARVIQDSSYHTQRDWMAKTKTAKFKYPCVYTVPKSVIPNLRWSSRNDKDHFGIPKVIWSTFRPISVGFFLDLKGEYGLTEFARGIVDDPKVLPDIQKALSSEKFRRFCSAISVGKLEINTKVIRLFRKDFWKEFT